MVARRVVRVGLGVLSVALLSAGSLLGGEPQASGAKKKGNADLEKAALESSSRPGGKAKTGLASLKPTTSSATSDLESEKDVYRIGIEDELQISVWREPELNSMVVVRPDGNITVPLLNDVQAIGLRPEELQTVLTHRLKAFVNEPQVTVVVRQIRSRKVYLFGEVVRQGTFSLNGRKTVLELLAEAGGLGPFAKSESIYILRNLGGRQLRIPFSYKKALAGRGESIALLPGDMVVVP